MGCRITGNSVACFYDSVIDVGFGPVATKEELEAFRNWLGKDPREVKDIMKEWNKYLEEE